LKAADLSNSTYNRRLSSIKKFYKYLINNNLKEKGKEILIEGMKSDKKKLEYLNPNEINLLREGLDIPEVSLVAIMEADKEGFLRSRRSLVQTIGRAARNIEGRVILYADIMTDSMKEAITETERRRKIQKEYNAYNHIDPKSIIKEIAEDLINLDYGIEEKKFENDKKVFRNKTDIEKEITKLEKKIKKLVEELDFEQAIVLRDEMLKLKELLLEF